MPTKKTTSDSGARKRARKNAASRSPRAPRVPRFATWDLLQVAVLEWCRGEVRTRNENPSFDLGKFEEQAHLWSSARADRPWFALQEAVAGAIAYVDAHPAEVNLPGYAAMLNGFLSTLCASADGRLLPIRERLKAWGRPYSSKEKHVIRGGTSFRAQLVKTFHLKRRACWWGERGPTVRDLAMLTLLAGCTPWGEEMKGRRAVDRGHVVDTTVRGVVQAEQAAIRVTLRRLSRGTSRPPHT